LKYQIEIVAKLEITPMKLVRSNPPTPPDAMMVAMYAKHCADVDEINLELSEDNLGLEKKNGELRAMVARLTQDLAQEKADKAAMAAQVACEPEAMISLSVAVARRPGVEYEWIRRRLENHEIEGEKRGGRWFLRYSSLLRVKRATLG
jgi:hypothetical protein